MKTQTYPFKSYALPPTLISTLAELGYVDASIAQQHVLPRALKGESLLARFETGSGKTHAFLIPIFAQLHPKQSLQAIIIVPTRELALQTLQFARAMSDTYQPALKITTVTGGYAKDTVNDALSPLPEIVIITPGKIPQFIAQVPYDILKQVRTLVLDEADMLLDPTFKPHIDAMLQAVPSSQKLVFSASIAQPLLAMMRRYIHPDAVIDPPQKTINPDRIQHALIDIKHQSLIQSIRDFIAIKQPYFLLIFSSKVTIVKSVYQQMIEAGMKVGMMHGDLTQRERRSMHQRIVQGEFAVVIASDMASRGIDLPAVSDVLSLDLPRDIDYYFHRAGRTGRYDQKGSSSVFYNAYEDETIHRLKDKGVRFNLMVLKQGILKPVTSFDRAKLYRKEDESLQKDIKIAIQKYRSSHVKPGYKKKVKLAVARVKKFHKRKSIQQKIRQRVYGGKS
jgi:ATP-dependent RNA helicase CshB